MSARDTQVGGDHYSKHNIQPWDVMQEYLTPEEFRGFLKGNIIKYALRHPDKGGKQDLEKLMHYSKKLIEVTG